MRPRIGLVVPDLAHGGGVPAVARFLKDAALRCGRFDLRMMSLSTSAVDRQQLAGYFAFVLASRSNDNQRGLGRIALRPRGRSIW